MLWGFEGRFRKALGRPSCNDYTTVIQRISNLIVSISLLTLLVSGFSAVVYAGNDRQFKDQFGNILHLASKATEIRRVIVLAPSLTESMFALGLGDRIVGVTTYCDYPPVAQQIAKVGGILDFDLERIVAFKPDLVLALASGQVRRKIEALSTLLPNRLYIFETENVKQVGAMLLKMGEMFAIEETAVQLAQTLERSVHQVTAKAATKAPIAALFLVGCEPGVAVGSKNFLNEWLALVGGQNIIDKSGYPLVDFEKLVAKKPSRIVVALDEDHASCQQMTKDLKKLTGVTPSFVGENLFQRPGPRVPLALERLQTALFEQETD